MIKSNTNKRYPFCERDLIGKREIVLFYKLLHCPRNRKNAVRLSTANVGRINEKEGVVSRETCRSFAKYA